MKIAIIGAGISGLVAAYKLNKMHEVTLFEANDYLGGHTHTHTIEEQATAHQIDTGFIVFNDRTYPNFMALLHELDVPYQKTPMGFSVNQHDSNFAYAGTSLNALFANRTNLVSLPFWRMLRDIVRFNRTAVMDIDSSTTFGDYLTQAHYSSYFIERYIVPMGAAIWSSDPAQILAMPMRFFVQFFDNHGLLTVTQQPQWYVIQGGSKTYVETLVNTLHGSVRLACSVRSVSRDAFGANVVTTEFGAQRFDHVIFACHSDQALALLSDPTHVEGAVLGAMPYQANTAVLHTDTSLLPIQKRAWAAWNYQLYPHVRGATLTYNMNILQNLNAVHTYCVTLNQLERIDPGKIIRVMHYQHPVFNANSVAAQNKWAALSGHNRTHYCGAYWGWGFHEDGVASALRVVNQLRLGEKHV